VGVLPRANAVSRGGGEDGHGGEKSGRLPRGPSFRIPMAQAGDCWCYGSRCALRERTVEDFGVSTASRAPTAATAPA